MTNVKPLPSLYKCPDCRGVHIAILASQIPAKDYEKLFSCYDCGAPSVAFIKAQGTPIPANIKDRRVIVPSAG